MKGQLRIETMWAFICVDDDGTEGVPAMQIGDVMFPMMGADLTRVDMLRPTAEQLAREGKKVTLVHFTTRTEVEVLG